MSNDEEDSHDGGAGASGGGGGGDDDCSGGGGGGGMSWSGKPKTTIQLAGEALISRIVASVSRLKV